MSSPCGKRSQGGSYGDRGRAALPLSCGVPDRGSAYGTGSAASLTAQEASPTAGRGGRPRTGRGVTGLSQTGQHVGCVVAKTADSPPRLGRRSRAGRAAPRSGRTGPPRRAYCRGGPGDARRPPRVDPVVPDPSSGDQPAKALRTRRSGPETHCGQTPGPDSIHSPRIHGRHRQATYASESRSQQQRGLG